MPKPRLTYDTPEIQVLLDKVAAGGATATAKTTAEWNASIGYIPAAGELIVYSDWKEVEEGGETRTIPGIKIGSGNAYVQDLVFVGGVESDVLTAHVSNLNIHTSQAEKTGWNNKLNIDDANEVVDETLIFNRN